METKQLLERALQLKPFEKALIVDGLLKSLDEPNKEIDDIWTSEAEKRLKAYRGGHLKGVPIAEIFGTNE
ncbi:MAG: addiction module protein [Bacteroidetes bacterium]|nr:addiction module protein [Bacteroidota bacterium]MBU2584041.1 addiction module protein [Bacteroidota bacterium]